MILPFVRELFADAEKSPAFARAASALKSKTPQGNAAAGRIRLSGLTPTAKALHLPLLHRAAGRPLIVIVASNRAADELLPIVQAFCELTGACDLGGIVALPAHDVLPYENLSPHPDIQEQQAIALRKIANGEAQIVIVPVAAALMRLREGEFYTELARTVRRGETPDLEPLVEHLNTVGYTRTDVVEMPGEYALRGGILDVYPPEAERPLRVELFGDEVESVRPFDPQTQRSSAASGGAMEEAVLLPLTPTPVREEILAAIHTRLSGRRISGDEEIVEQAMVATGVNVFPGWELYAPLAGANATLFDLLPNAAVLFDEPSAVTRELDRWWERVLEMHERSGVGALAAPEELYLSADELQAQIATMPRADMEELAIETGGEEPLHFSSQNSPRFHGSVPAMVEQIQKFTTEGRRVVFCGANMGEVERLADIFSEYNVPFRLGSRARRPGSETFVEETSYMAGDYAATTLVRAYVPD